MASQAPLPRLRLGSILVSRGGVQYTVKDAIVLIGERGGESLSVLVERMGRGKNDSFYVTLGMLANMTRGAAHKPGAGSRIDWNCVPRLALSDLASKTAHSLSRLSTGFNVRAPTSRP